MLDPLFRPVRAILGFGEQEIERPMVGAEHEILDAMCKGKTNAEIGLALNISPFTVKNHVRRILKKLGCGNRAHAAAKYSQAPQEVRKAPQEAR